MRLIPDIIETFIQGLTWEAEVWTASFNGVDSTTITVYNVLHLRPGLFVTIAGFPLQVQSVDYSANSFTVLGDYSSADAVTFPTPHYFHGTQLSVVAETSKLRDEAKVPMVWLHEVVRENLGGEMSVASVASCRLFFLDVANYVDWTTDEHYAKVIRPMRNLSDYFLQEFRRPNKNFQATGDAQLYTHVKFGAVSEKGHFQSVLNDRLSGVELLVEMTVRECNTNRGIIGRKPTGFVSNSTLAYELEFALVG